MDPDLNFAALALLQILLFGKQLSRVTREGNIHKLWDLYKNIKLNPCSQNYTHTEKKMTNETTPSFNGLKDKSVLQYKSDHPNLSSTVILPNYMIFPD